MYEIRNSENLNKDTHLKPMPTIYTQQCVLANYLQFCDREAKALSLFTFKGQNNSYITHTFNSTNQNAK